jgi:hypothetical protein
MPQDPNLMAITSLVTPLTDQHIDVRRAALTRLNFETARKHIPIVKAVKQSLYDQVQQNLNNPTECHPHIHSDGLVLQDEGYRKLACEWLQTAVHEVRVDMSRTPMCAKRGSG